MSICICLFAENWLRIHQARKSELIYTYLGKKATLSTLLFLDQYALLRKISSLINCKVLRSKIVAVIVSIHYVMLSLDLSVRRRADWFGVLADALSNGCMHWP